MQAIARIPAAQTHRPRMSALVEVAVSGSEVSVGRGMLTEQIPCQETTWRSFRNRYTLNSRQVLLQLDQKYLHSDIENGLLVSNPQFLKSGAERIKTDSMSLSPVRHRLRIS